MGGSNNPPDVFLELTMDQAKFLLENCDKNISLGLSLVMQTESREIAEKIVEVNEKFKEIREKLRNQGVRDET